MTAIRTARRGPTSGAHRHGQASAVAAVFSAAE